MGVVFGVIVRVRILDHMEPIFAPKAIDMMLRR